MSGKRNNSYFKKQGGRSPPPVEAAAAPQRQLPANFVCTTCRQDLRNANALMEHMEKTDHGTWFYCSFCDWSFVTQELLDGHVAAVHPGSVDMHRAQRIADLSKQQDRRNQMDEGGALSREKKKHYDFIVRNFVELGEEDVLEFPCTLTPAERHHVHQLAMHYGLTHKSSGSKENRVLRLARDIGTALPGDELKGAVRQKTLDGFQGVENLGDIALRDLAPQLLEELKPQIKAMLGLLTDKLQHPSLHRKRFQTGHKLRGVPPPKPRIDKKKYLELAAFRAQLPTVKQKTKLIDFVNNNSTVIVSGDTGCGKTTQVPQLLLDAGLFKSPGTILCTQPRRISAISVAQRVAEERGEACGDSVGYIIRFENVTSCNTRVVYMTTGILLRRLHNDPLLQGVSCVIIDEVHERDVETDFALLLLRDLILAERKDLKVVIMSATIQINRLVDYFRQATGVAPPVLLIPGTLFEVKEYYLDHALNWLRMPATAAPAMQLTATKTQGESGATNSPTEDDGSYEKLKQRALEAFDKDASTIVPYDVVLGLIELFHQEHLDQLWGAILVFLPGWAAIDRMSDCLRRCQFARQFSILALHSSLTSAEQARVFHPAPNGFRKIILSTNIAETSITIDDVVAVIDSGLHKGTTYDPAGNTSSLTSQLISKANGLQRRGRAGRCQPGICVHLLPQVVYESLPAFLDPQIVRSPLEEVCLQIKAVVEHRSCADVLSHALDAPSQFSIDHAVEFLKELGALDPRERLTNLGRVLASMPIHPLLGKMLLFASVVGVLEPVATVAGCLGSKSPFVKPMAHQIQDARNNLEYFDRGYLSDHLAVLNLFQQWQAAPRSQDFASSKMADNATLRGIDRSRKQLKELVLGSGFLKRIGDPAKYASRNQANLGLIRFVLLWCLYPRVAVYEVSKTRRHLDVFTWDNKPTSFSQSSILSKLKPPDVTSREFAVYFERMRIESALSLFDGTLVSRTAFALACSNLTVTPLSKFDPSLLDDPESKFKEHDSCALPTAEEVLKENEEQEISNYSVLEVDGSKKSFFMTRAEAEVLVGVHETIEFFFSLAVQQVDVTQFPDKLVWILAKTISSPIEQQQASAAVFHNGETNLKAVAAVRPNWLDPDSDEEVPDDEPQPVLVESEETIIQALRDEKNVNVLYDAFGDLSWLRRHTDQLPKVALKPNADVRVSVPAQQAPTIEATDTEQGSAEQTPVEETPFNDTPVEQTPVEETPFNDTPVEQTPVEETPFNDTPVEQTPHLEPRAVQKRSPPAQFLEPKTEVRDEVLPSPVQKLAAMAADGLARVGSPPDTRKEQSAANMEMNVLEKMSRATRTQVSTAQQEPSDQHKRNSSDNNVLQLFAKASKVPQSPVQTTPTPSSEESILRKFARGLSKPTTPVDSSAAKEGITFPVPGASPVEKLLSLPGAPVTTSKALAHLQVEPQRFVDPAVVMAQNSASKPAPEDSSSSDDDDVIVYSGAK